MNVYWLEYLQFVQDRHDAYLNRQAGLPAPWTDNEILQVAKFTNVFRVLDTGTQFLLHMLEGEKDINTVAGRAFLYRYTNRPEPWVFFRDLQGRFPTAEDIVDGTVKIVWDAWKAEGMPIFGPAYRMFSGAENPGVVRSDWVIGLAAQLIREEIPAEILSLDGAPAEQLNALKKLPRCANFMSMQILTDIGYTGILPSYDENTLVVPGPGAIAGAHAVGAEPMEAIYRSVQTFQDSGTVLLKGLAPSLMDVQNTFCEFSKYVRILRGGKPRAWKKTPGPLMANPRLSVRWKQR